MKTTTTTMKKKKKKKKRRRRRRRRRGGEVGWILRRNSGNNAYHSRGELRFAGIVEEWHEVCLLCRIYAVEGGSHPLHDCPRKEACAVANAGEGVGLRFLPKAGLWPLTQAVSTSSVRMLTYCILKDVWDFAA